MLYGPSVPSQFVTVTVPRGTILHKLMEEVLTGETQDTAAELERRATELLIQLDREPSVDPKNGIAPKELAATIIRTLNLPEIAALRPRLMPELSVGTTETLVAGIADAVAPDGEDGIEAIIDWKSDVEINPDRLALLEAAWSLSQGDRCQTRYFGAYDRRKGRECLMQPGPVGNVQGWR
jgi:hypothetical protein